MRRTQKKTEAKFLITPIPVTLCSAFLPQKAK